MKKLLIGLLMLVSTNLMASPALLLQDKVETAKYPEKSNIITSKVECVEGYQYLYMSLGDTIAVTQMMKATNFDTRAAPIKCGEE